MENQYYLRIDNKGSITFVLGGIHDILESDIPLTTEDYNRFFELQSKGKQFRPRETPTGEGLFNYVEEYMPDPAPPSEMEILQKEVLDQGEYMVDMDYKLATMELGF